MMSEGQKIRMLVFFGSGGWVFFFSMLFATPLFIVGTTKILCYSPWRCQGNMGFLPVYAVFNGRDVQRRAWGMALLPAPIKDRP
jgi:hypothetical protein